MKKLILLLLVLPLLATAQDKPVQVPASGFEGTAFTIRIPVKFPENMTVQYAWYRNDTLIEDSHMLLLGEKTIAYTIPAEKAFGSAVYHFTYLLHDDFPEWSHSPRYAVSFLPPQDCNLNVGSIAVELCELGAGSITIELCEFGTGSIIVEYCELDVGSIEVEQCDFDVGSIAIEQCELNAGSVSVEYCEFNAGTITAD